jgi:hypothetical protein
MALYRGTAIKTADTRDEDNMAEDRIVIRGGYVITMDEDLGELPTGDVLIEGSRIIEVAPSVSSSGAGHRR